MEQSITFQTQIPFTSVWDTIKDSITATDCSLINRLRQRLAFTSPNFLQVPRIGVFSRWIILIFPRGVLYSLTRSRLPDFCLLTLKRTFLKLLMFYSRQIPLYAIHQQTLCLTIIFLDLVMNLGLSILLLAQSSR